MEYPSKLLKTYYNSIDSTEENVEKIAIKIAEEVKQKYITMYGKVIGRQISTINSFIEEAYWETRKLFSTKKSLYKW